MKGGPEGERMGWSERSGVSGGVMRGQGWKSVEKGGREGSSGVEAGNGSLEGGIE